MIGKKTQAAVLGVSAALLAGGIGYGVIDHYEAGDPNPNDKVFVDPNVQDGSKEIKADPFPTAKPADKKKAADDKASKDKKNAKGSGNKDANGKTGASKSGGKKSSGGDKTNKNGTNPTFNGPVDGSTLPEPVNAVPVDPTVAETPAGVKDGSTKASDLPKYTVSIPRIKTVTKINPAYGDVKNKQLTVPKTVAFAKYKYGADYNDTVGTMVLASHINYGSTPGPLKRANQMKLGDKAYVVDGNGHTRTWKLQKVNMFKKTNLPKEIFTRKGDNRLVMVTCGGELMKTSDGRHFDSNVILYFVPSSN